jgi:hypothetical protein
MFDGLRRAAKNFRRRYIVGTLFAIFALAYGLVLVRALASAAAYRNVTAAIALTGAQATADYLADTDAKSGDLLFYDQARKIRRHVRGIPSADYLMDVSTYAHVLQPQFHRPRQLLVVLRRSVTMPKTSEVRILLNGTEVGSVGFAPNEERKAYSIDMTQAQAPPADTWHVRLENRLGGIVVKQVGVLIGPAP